MAYQITLNTLNQHARYFNNLAKSGLDFSILLDQTYSYASNSHQVLLQPSVHGQPTVDTMAKMWAAGTKPFKTSSMELSGCMSQISSKPSCCPVTASHYRKTDQTVKFFAETVFSSLGTLDAYLITASPNERGFDNHTYRTVVSGDDYYRGSVVFCAHEEHPAYEYIDAGHVLVFASPKDSQETRMFVTNMLSLDMNYIMAAFSIHPPCIDDILQKGSFIQAKDARAHLLRVERAIPAKYREDYQALKTLVRADFEANAQNVMIGKLTRDEAPFVDLNNIRISKTRAVYEHVSIEADDLTEVVFSSLNPNEEWDIFTFINIYTDWVEGSFLKLPMNATETGFKNKKVAKFKINDIPIKVECFTDNTRRAVNGVLVNTDELSRVIRRASCYEDAKLFNLFVEEVGRISLFARDALANGMPTKTVFLDTDVNSHGKPATPRHPKLRFTKKQKTKTCADETGYYLVIRHLDKNGKVERTVERRIGKFVTFLRKVEMVNKGSYVGYTGQYKRTGDGGYVLQNGEHNSCAKKLLEIIPDFVEDVTAEDKTALVGTINKERTDAEKKSEELLAYAVSTVSAEKMQRNGKNGYKVKGKLRSYFVEEESLRVCNLDTGAHICIVNKGNPDAQGVGKDALVSRIFTLANDSSVVKDIHTLAAGPAAVPA